MARDAATFFVFLATVFSLGNAQVDFDFLILSQEWPPTFCKDNRCRFPQSAVKGWNIHGLWPSNFDNDNPEYCSGDAFDSNKIAPIRSLLQKNWADLKNYDNPTDFWSYEWKKHGRCGSTDTVISTELRYFNTSIQLKIAAKLDEVLTKNNIVPNDDSPYQLSDIEDVIKKEYGVSPEIRCSDSGGWVETRLCYDPSLRPISCPSSSVAGTTLYHRERLGTEPCRGSVMYPTFGSMRRRMKSRFFQRLVDFDHL